MAVEIVKPDTHKRSYSFLELENGLRAIVASDPKCDKAGAAVTVNVGMCHERKDLPGLAHFLEHMLFTGTKKYPKEGGYQEFIEQNGGGSNANTACYFTNYMFDIKPEMLEEGLDRFARFFIEPLLTQDCTLREINAVDSEFQRGHTSPWWRYVGIMHMSANPEHPFHVAVGNNKVLRDDPKERGIDLYEEMVKFYSATYSANGMTACVFGKEGLPELEAIVKEKFGGVVNKNVTMPIGDFVSDKPPFLPKDWNRQVLQNPVKDIKELTFSWVIPYQRPLWKSKPAEYVSHLLGYEGTGSVIAVLKQQGLISGCTSGGGSWLEGAFSLMNVDFELTDKGLTHIAEIGTHLFAFIGMLQKIPVEKRIVEEMQKLRKVQFRFAEDTNAFDLCAGLASALQRLPPSEVLAGDTLVYEYDPAAISDLVARLTLDSVRVSFMAKCVAERCTEKDTSYDSPMAFLPLEAEWLTQWSAALTAGDGSSKAALQAAGALGLHLPEPNPFIPEDLSLRELPAEPPQLPVALDTAVRAASCIFHRQDDVFRQPKAYVAFQIYSPYAMQDAESFMKVEVWCRTVEEALNEYAYDATVAGVHYALGMRSNCISLIVSGFNDKLDVLLSAVTEKMQSMVEVPENIYSIVADAYADEIRNTAFHSQPYAQCSIRFRELATRGMTFPSYLRYEAFQSLQREGLAGLAGKIFEACHVEAMMLGNLSPEDARKLSATLAKGLRLERPLASLPDRSEAVLPEGRTLWDLLSTDEEDPNHAVWLRVQMPLTLETEMCLRLLDKILSTKFFEILRTQQQLGYAVQMNANSSECFCYINAIVQSEFPPDYVRSRIDAFFDEHLKHFIPESLTEEEFQVCCQGLLSELKVAPKNLGEEMAHYQRYFNDRTYEFSRRKSAIDFLESPDSASLDRLRTFVRETVLTAPWFYMQVRKTNTKEDKPIPEGAELPKDPPELRHWTSHRETVRSFTTSATWLQGNCAVVS